MPYTHNPWTGKPDYFDRGVGKSNVKDPQDGDILVYTTASGWSNTTASGVIDPTNIDHSQLQNIGINSHDEIDTKLSNLEDSYVKDKWFEQVSSGTGQINPPPNGEFILDQWPGGVDAVVSTVSSGSYGVLPDYEHAYNSNGEIITTSLDSSGNFVLSGNPITYPVGIIYAYRIRRVNYDYTKSLLGPEIDEYAYLSKVSMNDATAGYLSDNIVTCSGIGSTISGIGYDESLQLNIDFSDLSNKNKASNYDDKVIILNSDNDLYNTISKERFTSTAPTSISGSTTITSGGDYYVTTNDNDALITIPDSTAEIAGMTIKVFKTTDSSKGVVNISTVSGQYIGDNTVLPVYSRFHGVSLIANWDSNNLTGNWLIKFDSRDSVQEVIVSHIGGEFNQIKEAVDWANDNATNDMQYMLNIKPGTYTLSGTVTITNNNILSIMGSNLSSVNIVPASGVITADTSLFDIQSETSIQGLTFDATGFPFATTVTGFSAIEFNHVGYDDYTALFDITVKGFNIGVNFNSPCATYFDLLDVRQCWEGVHLETGAQCNGNRLYTSECFNNHLHIDGSGLYPVNLTCSTYRFASPVTNSGTGLYIEGDNASCFMGSGFFYDLEYDIKTYDDSSTKIISSSIEEALYNTIEQHDSSSIMITNSNGYFQYDRMYVEDSSNVYLNSLCVCAKSNIIGNFSDEDQNLIVVGIGSSTNPTLKYKYNYDTGYKTLLFNNDNYNDPTALGVESQNEQALLTAFVAGPNALAHSSTIKLYSDQSGVKRGWDINKGIGATPELSFDYIGTTTALTLNYDGTINLNSGVSVNKILDDDTMASDDQYAIATQQSIKAYVDNNIDTHIHDDRYYTETELDSGQLDNRYYTESELDDIFTTNSGNVMNIINTKSDIGHGHNADEINYVNSYWETTNVSGALDSALYYLETTNATGRIKPEIVLSVSSPYVTVHSGTGFISYENYSRRFDWPETNIDFSSGYSDGFQHIYIDTSGTIQISMVEPDPNRNIVFGKAYITNYSDTVVGTLINSPVWLDTSSTRTIDALSKMGAFIYDETLYTGKLSIDADLTWNVLECRAQHGPMSYDLTYRDETGFQFLPTPTSFIIYTTLDNVWKSNFQWGTMGGLFPTDLWNDTTYSGLILSNENYNFTTYSPIITVSGVDLSSSFEMYNQIHLTTDSSYMATMISGVIWDGTHSNIILFSPYLGSTTTGNAYIDKCLRKIPEGSYGRYDSGRSFDDKFFIVVDTQYYSSEELAESAEEIQIPSFIRGDLVRTAEVITSAGSTYTNGLINKIIDKRPLPFSSSNATYGVTHHGELYGLSDDDHPQYLNTSRGDNRYYTQAQVDTLSGTLSDSSNIQYNNSNWDVTNVRTALDEVTDVAENVLGSGRISPEQVLSVSGTSTLVVSAGKGYINYDDFHRSIEWDTLTLDVTGFTEGNYYAYIDSSGSLQTSLSDPGYTTNIILGYFYYGGTRIAIVTDCSCILESAGTRVSQFGQRLGTFIYDDGGIVQLMGGNDRKIISTACKAQNALLDYNLPERDSNDIGSNFFCYYKTPDTGWEVEYYFTIEEQGEFPVDRYNNTTASGTITTSDCTFTNGNNVVTCGSDITSEIDEFDCIYLTSDTSVRMSLVSGTNWTGSQTDITLYNTYKGSSTTGTTSIIKALDKIPNGKYAKHMVARSLDGNMHLVPGQAIFNSLAEAQVASPPEVPESLSETGIKMSYVYTTPGSGTLTLEDIRPLPFHKTEGGRQTSSQTTTEHGDLSGLTSDDHPQYILSNGSRDFNSIVSYTSHPTFTNDVDIIDKKYVDDTVVTDHGNMSGLSDDDHTQYMTTNATRTFSNVVSYNGNKTFSSDTNMVSKKYVDDEIANLTTDHGELVGLEDDDHLQYMTVSGSRVFTEAVSYNESVTSFTSDTNLVSKKYVDDSITTAYTNVIYVDKGGNDSTGDGTLIKPYLTVQAAINNASTSDLVIVNAGTYTEDITVTSQVTIASMCPTKTVISGKATFSHDASTCSVRQIQFNNTNDHALVFSGTSDSSRLNLVNSIAKSTWTNGSGQTTTTAKSSVKLERGIFFQSGGKTIITTSNDNVAEHNTATYWLTGSNNVNAVIYNVYQTITNTSDIYQNLMVIFNNNTNSNTVFKFKNGFMGFTGVINSNNYTAPFYNYSSSADSCLIEGNYISIENSGNCYTAFSQSSSTDIKFTNNTVVPINVSTVYIAYENGSGTIDLANCFFDVSAPPLVFGDVDYSITLNNGNLYVSDSISLGSTFSFFTGTYADVILDEDDMISNDENALVTQQSVKSYVDNTIDTELTVTSGILQAQIDALEAYDTPVCQIRRTTNYTMPGSYTDITFDTVDVETDTNVLEHDATNTDRILIKDSGYYLIYYRLLVEAGSNYSYSRVRINDSTVVNGSEVEVDTYSGEVHVLDGTFYTYLQQNDYISLQAYTNGTCTAHDDTLLLIASLKGAKGESGPAGSDGADGAPGTGSTIHISQNGTIEASQVSNLNFNGGITVTSGVSYTTVDVTDKIFQGYNATATSINSATPVAVPWDGEDIKDAGYTHSTSSNASRVYVDSAGWYEINYNIYMDSDSGSRTDVRGRVRKNGVTYIDRGTTAAYTRNATNDVCNISPGQFLVQLASGDYIEVMCDQQGDSGTVNSVANASHVYLKLLRYV